MNTQKAATWFGWVLLIMGILGFIPGVVFAGGYLVGVFLVSILLNTLFILIGLLSLASASTALTATRFFKIIGIVFLVFAIAGIVNNTLAGVIALNTADIILHGILGVFAVYLGYSK